MNVHFVLSEFVAKDTQSFYFEHPAQLRYVAGQFIEMYLPHDSVDSRGDKRWFTLSSSPSEELLCVTTKITSKRSSFKERLHQLKPGDSVSISEAMGDFVLPKDATIPLVFIAGGIGITPYRSMIAWLRDHQLTRDIQLIYSVRSHDYVAFSDVLGQPFVTASMITDGTRLAAPELEARISDITDKHIYIAGPERMTEQIVADLESLGVSKYRMVTDYFPGYPVA